MAAAPAGKSAEGASLPATPFDAAGLQGPIIGGGDGRMGLADTGLGLQRDELPLLRLSGPGQAAQGAGLMSVESLPEARQITRQVAEQVAPSVHRTSAGQVTIQMAPAELGRVDISMQPREQGMTLLIAADRPETLDLLRRHVDLLAEDLRAMGWSDLSFQFGAGGRSPEDRGKDERGPSDPASGPVGHPAGASQELRSAGGEIRALSAGRLDLRY